MAELEWQCAAPRSITVLWFALLAVLFAACGWSVASAATIILVRHAERSEAMSADAPLSPAGEKRAQELARILRDSNVQRIYVTELLRTQQTAAPVAARFHLKPIIIAKKDTDVLVNQLRKLDNNETALVVGHADTVPLIIDRLGAGSEPPFRDSEYDRLMVLFTAPESKVHLLTLRYRN